MKTAAGSRHSVGVDRASADLIPTVISSKQQAPLVVDLRRKVDDPVTSDASVTERGKDSQMGQSSTVLKKFHGMSEQQPMRTSRFEGEIG